MTIEAFYSDNFATQYNGHVLDILPQLEPESIQCCVTSPPYWGLRDYGLPPQIWDDNPHCSLKDAHFWDNDPCEICGAWQGSLGLEPTPELYIQHIVQVFREVNRVLRKDGTLWLNLGSSYAGGTRDYNSFRRDKAHVCVPRMEIAPGFEAKDLVPIPWMVAMALQQDGWWLRSDIIWAKPNPMPESVTDRPTRSHEYLFLLTKSAHYFYDADAVREEPTVTPKANGEYGGKSWHNHKNDLAIGQSQYKQIPRVTHPAGRNLRSVWTIATEPTPEAHFATFPEKLVIPCIKAGTSEKGCCPECGAPWVRVVEKEKTKPTPNMSKTMADHQGKDKTLIYPVRYETQSKTIGWKPSCECGNPKTIPCTVLDSFSGSGKVLIVAKKLFRKAIGIELNAEYCEMPVKKLKPGRLSF